MSEKILPKNIQVLLNQVIRENGLADYSMHIKPGSNLGDGFNSDLLSITASDNLSEKRLDIVCKTCSNSNAYIFFKREVLVYNKLIPILAKFQAEKKLLENDQFLSYLKCYAAVANDEINQYIVVMEDVRLQGFEMRNRAGVTPIENTRLVLREFGKLHGLSIAMKDQQPNEFSIVKQTPDIYGTVCQRLMDEIFHKHFDCTIKALRNEQHRNIMSYIKNNYSAYVKRCINGDTADHFLVLSHGDLWNNNVLYRYDEDGKVKDALFLDWQQARYGSLGLDLIYNIFSASDKAQRDKEYENFLRIYYESLVKTVTLLGTSSNKLFTFEELKTEMKRCGNFALTVMPILIYGSSAHQMIDQNSTTVLNVKDQSEYNRQINEVVEDILTLGDVHK